MYIVMQFLFLCRKFWIEDSYRRIGIWRKHW